MRSPWSSVWLWGSLLVSGIAAAQRETVVYPQKYQTSHHAANASGSTCITLSSSNVAVILDYGTEIGGFPVFDVQSVAGPVQVEAKYSESRVALDAPFGDGPWTFSNGLSNTFRVETFNVTESGHVQSFLIQGGLRWQRLQLLSPESTVKICRVGIRSANDRTAVDALPGHFECSNSLYNEIWALGPRTVQQACIANNTAPSTWEVTSDGAYLRGQQPAASVKGVSYANYTMSFRSKIVRGGTGWKVASGVTGYGPYFVLTSEYPPESTFLNTNRTLVPPNTLVVGYGYNLVNQTSLPTGAVKHFPLSFNVTESKWYNISTTINQTGYSVSINDHPAVFVALKNIQTPSASIGGPSSLTSGTWAFGPYQDQIAYVKDVEVSAQNGTQLYQNPMTDESVLEEYGVMTNSESVCLDGAKRDRLVWSGDFAHTYRVITASTHRQDFLTGTLAYSLDRQATSGVYEGFFSMSPTMGQSAEYTLIYNAFGILDYQMLFLNTFAGYYLDFADDEFLQKYWPRAKRGVNAVLPLVDSVSGLVVSQSIPGSFFLGPANGTAPSALLVYTLQRMGRLANIIGDTEAATNWTTTACHISDAINRQLWNDKTGIYGESLTSLNASSLTGTAWSILADVANTTQAQRSIAALSTLRLGIGYKESSSTSNASNTQLSPNLSGFLLEALFQHSRSKTAPQNATTEAISVLLNRLWPAMVNQDKYYTGAAWEYVDAVGRPGLEFYTSHAHPWGAAPTYVFTEYVLGIQSVTPGFKEWAFRPALLDVEVSWARGRVPTPFGTIRGGWTVDRAKGHLDLNVCAPEGTKGTVWLPLSVESYTVNGEERSVEGVGLKEEVGGGKCARVSVTLK
ncbi:Six-hairpin glycosidase [Aspergillus ruber CBS 135680]|uniref:Six-hairpin glycosidase n=1 Tax=Aspergillus ruber (strain CBS 135680) TaxID=1388766 RepID=A0A017S272_ASPRC|nr:Six-hairpin glycosidase [Aspergillus ruber CBS 135680]EYE90739.1 Six-hairpin glycosidase [Aspergillus ruber CBS 135680]